MPYPLSPPPRAMTHLDKAFGFMSAPHTWVSRKDEGDKVIVCERGDLVFVFNFHPTNSYTDYKVRPATGGKLCMCAPWPGGPNVCARQGRGATACVRPGLGGS